MAIDDFPERLQPDDDPEERKYRERRLRLEFAALLLSWGVVLGVALTALYLWITQ